MQNLGLSHERRSVGFGIYGVEEDVWVYDERGNGGLRQTPLWGASQHVVLTRHYKGDYIKEDKMDGACGMLVCGEEEKCMQGFGREIWRNETTWNLDADSRIILKCILGKLAWRMWTGLIRLRTGTINKLFWTWLWTFGFHKLQGISWPDKEIFASQEGLYSMHKCNLGEGVRGQMPLKYFFYLRTVFFLATDLKKGK